VATESAWRRFRDWRRRRPFWGGLLLLLAAGALFLSANLTLADLEVHFGQEGYLSYLLPAILLLCGLLIWFTPAQRLFYAVIGLVTALYSLIGLNLGGFGVGMVLGIVGGALAIAWTPGAGRPAETATAADPETTDPAPETAPFESPGDDGAPTAILPGFDDDHGDPRPPTGGGAHRQLLVLTLVPMVVAAIVLVAGRATPARADDDCPKGLPSRKATATQPAPPSAPARRKRAPVRPAPAESPTPSASPDPADADTGNPIVDGWHDFVDGIGDLLGGGGGEEAGPAPSPSPGERSPSASPSVTPSPSTPARPAPRSAMPTPQPSSSLTDVPCLGPRVFKEANPDDVPMVAAQHGVMEGDSLTMYDSTYDGVIEVPTARGPLKVLKFSMRKSVTEPFSLTIPEAGGHTTLIRSNALTVDGNVRFYTPKFTGKLFGLIPVEFTPESPPPLTLPVLWFTDIRIDLAFVRSDVLTADPLDIRELD
jgi:hypothetical protein